MSEEKNKPGFDEQTLGILLEAAFVLQEQGRQPLPAASQLEPPADQRLAPGPSVQVPSLPAAEPHAQEGAHTAVEVLHAVPATQEPFLPEPSPAKPTSVVPPSKDDYTFTLAQIVGTQDQIRLRNLDLENAISLVTERVTEIARAGGAAIAMLDGMKARYRGAAGLMTLPPGTELPVEKALCVACLRAGQVIRCSNLNSEFLLDVDACQRRGIQAIIAVPIYHDGKIAGALELYFATSQAFIDQDIHTCQLMAGLITEALAREEEQSWKKSIASERAVMLETLEKLKPSLAALIDAPAVQDLTAKGAAVKSTAIRNTSADTASSTLKFTCRNCGHQMMAEEQFCGSCGTPRNADRTPVRKTEYEPPNLKSTAVSLWHLQEELKKSASAAPATGELAREFTISDPVGEEKPLADSIEEEMPEFFAAPELRIAKMPPAREIPEQFVSPPIVEAPTPKLRISLAASEEEDSAHTQEADKQEREWERDKDRQEHHQREQDQQEKDQTKEQVKEQEEEVAVEEDIPEPAVVTTLATPAPAANANWSSATSAREFLEQLAATKNPGGLVRFWHTRRGDIYLAVAVILVVAVIRWGIWSSHSVGAIGSPTPASAGQRKPAPDSDLSTFDRMLISLGLAEAPPAPEYRGNPDTQVWIDLHTALYYCPGADLYGKTPKGRFATQRDAQLDQFEPAYRKTCD